MAVIAKGLGVADIGDTGFLKKFAKCKEWLAWIVSRVVPKPLVEYSLPDGLTGYQIVALDASDVREKGRSGRIFKLHYIIDLFKMCSVAFKITSHKTGEALSNFDIKSNWLILADRAYGTLTGIEHCLKSGAGFIIRLKHGAFNIYDEDGKAINLLDKIRGVTSDTAIDVEGYVKLARLGSTKVRVCATKIPDNKLGKVDSRQKREDSKRQRKTSAEAKKMSNYVVVITCLPSTVSAYEIVSLYHLRWQVEIYFKRLKSIIDFGNVPLRREDSIFTWLNGKLLISLLIENMVSEVSFFP
jgi:hypothetical protein